MGTQFMTPEQFADVAQIDVTTVRKLLREGRLEGVRIGGQWRIPKGALDRLEAAAAAPRAGGAQGFLAGAVAK